MKMSNEKRKKLYKFINIVEIKFEYNNYYANDYKVKQIKGLTVKFDLCMFKNISIYIHGMDSINEYLIKDYIIENLEELTI